MYVYVYVCTCTYMYVYVCMCMHVYVHMRASMLSYVSFISYNMISVIIFKGNCFFLQANAGRLKVGQDKAVNGLAAK